MTTYRPDTIKVFRSFTESLIYPIDIKSVVNNVNGTYTLSVCRLLHAQPNFKITIGATEYKITAIDDDLNTITVEGTTPITATSFELYKPYFFYGTLLQMNVELTNQAAVNIPHVPMVFFQIPFVDTDYNDTDPINKSVTGDLFFLTQGDNFKWLNEQAFDEGVRPMRRLQQYYVDQMIELGMSIFNIVPANQEFKVGDLPKVGVQTRKGTEKSWWCDNLSGCSMHMEGLGLWDDGKCHGC